MENNDKCHQKWVDLYNFAKAEYGDFGMGDEALWAFELLTALFPTGGIGMIEIGSGFGASFHCWGQFFNAPRISIDIPISLPISANTAIQNRETNWKKYLGEQELYPLVADSRDWSTITAVTDILKGRQVDWLFIDGDHSYEASLNDYHNYKQFVRKGGFIGFHDVVNPDFAQMCGRTFREISSDKKFWLTPWNCAGIGIIKVE